MIDAKYIKKQYLATDEEVKRLLDQVTCEICGQELEGIRSAVDHDHITGKIRGRLCHYCNRQVVGCIENAAGYRGITTEHYLQLVNAYFRKYS